MIQFTENDSKVEEDLLVLRRRLLNNSKELLHLFKQRCEIARSIGELKRSNGLKIRDMTQEDRVKKILGVRDPIEERFINALFELTIMSENENETLLEDLQEDEHEILQEILADLLCSPGDWILTNSCGNMPFVRRALERGAHLVDDICGNVDLHITLSRRDDTSTVSIKRSRWENTSYSRKSFCPRVIKLEVIG